MPDPALPPILSCSQHAFYLDLDGTLAEIVAHPDDAEISDNMRGLIARLITQTKGAVAIVSGRSLADIDRLLNPLQLPAAGSHGLEMRGADQVLIKNGAEIEPGVVETITRFAQGAGLVVEKKPGAVALHYRMSPEREAECHDLIDDIVASHPHYRAIHGKMVSELAQRGLDKGTAIEHLAKTPPLKTRRPVMVGDDVTDEDGFEMAQKLGGYGIKIGDGPTRAKYRLHSIEAFSDWLTTILRERN